MKMVKSKHILVISVLSIFLVQITGSVYSPAAKPVAKPAKLAPPVTKPVTKPTLKAATPVTIKIPVLLNDILLGSTTNDLFDKQKDLIMALNNGETFTGTIEPKNSGATLTLTGSGPDKLTTTGTFKTEPAQISYSCDGTGYINVRVTSGTAVTIIGTKTPSPITFTTPALLYDFVLGGSANSHVNDPTLLIEHLNNGETFTGTIVNGGVLTLKSATATVTGTFKTNPVQISYMCNGTGYTNIPVFPGATITIIGTKTPQPITIKISAPLNDFVLGGTKNSYVNDPTLLIKHLNNGETFTGTIEPNGSLTLKSATATVTGTFETKVNQISYKCDNTGYINVPVTLGATVTIIGMPSSGIHQIDPFVITLDVYKGLISTDKASVTFFSRFDAVLALSNYDTPSDPRQANADNPAYFLQSLSDCVNNAYNYDGNNLLSPKFNDKRYIYGQFSNGGKTLQLYKDSDHSEIIGTFSLPNQKHPNEYIQKLLWHTDAHIPPHATTDSRVDPNGNVRYWVTFDDQNAAILGGKIVIELINPNDSAYKELSQITDFTGLTLADSDNTKVTIDSNIEKRIHDIFYTAMDGYDNEDLILNAYDQPCSGYGKHYSEPYNPRILIYTNKDLFFELSYNVMYVEAKTNNLPLIDCEQCNIHYQEQPRGENWIQDIKSLKNISSIICNGAPTLKLIAPILIPQVLFYFNDNFNPNDGIETEWKKHFDSYSGIFPCSKGCFLNGYWNGQLYSDDIWKPFRCELEGNCKR